jgi:acetolactate synthase-1/2/3 large subunit
MRLTGAEIVAEMLIQEGVPYAIGIGGHGNLPLLEAFRQRQQHIQVIMPRHEQAAVHMADGYYRVKGEPLAVFTSMGRGSITRSHGDGLRRIDSIAAADWRTLTYMRGWGVLRSRAPALVRLPRMLSRRSSEAGTSTARSSSRARSARRSTRCARAARHGDDPLPMDVRQLRWRWRRSIAPGGRTDRPAGDPAAIRQAAECAPGQKPVIVEGGGVILSGRRPNCCPGGAYGACVVSPMQAKSALPEPPVMLGIWAPTHDLRQLHDG